MKLFLIGTIVLFSTSLFAEKSALVSTGFDNGGIHLGADFEYQIARTHGVGGYLRFFSKNDSSNEVGQDGLVALGGFIRPHFNRGRWDLGVAPGFGIFTVDPANDDETQTTLGPSVMVDVLYQFSKTFAVGLEWMHLYSWFNSDLSHELKDNLAVRARFNF